MEKASVLDETPFMRDRRYRNALPIYETSTQCVCVCVCALEPSMINAIALMSFETGCGAHGANVASRRIVGPGPDHFKQLLGLTATCRRRKSNIAVSEGTALQSLLTMRAKSSSHHVAQFRCPDASSGSKGNREMASPRRRWHLRQSNGLETFLLILCLGHHNGLPRVHTLWPRLRWQRRWLDVLELNAIPAVEARVIGRLGQKWLLDGSCSCDDQW